jgi:hypothetical protein
MAANIPDMGAVAHLGGQFNTEHNILDAAQKSLSNKSKKYAQAHNTQVKQTANARQKFAQSAAQGIKQGQAAYAKNVAGQQKAAAQAAKAHAQGVKSGKVAPAQGAPPRTFAMGSTPQQKQQRQQRNQAHGQALQMQNQMNRAGAAKQSQSAKTMQQQRNFAHGEALKFQSAQFKLKQSQVNNAHGQAIQEAKQRSKGGTAMKTQQAPTRQAPSLTPAFSNPTPTHTPVQGQHIAPVTFSSQLTPQKPVAKPQGSPVASFSSGSGNGAAKPPQAPKKATQSGGLYNQDEDSGWTSQVGAFKPSGKNTPDAPLSPQFSGGNRFPQHSHPSGSSTAPLPNLTAAQPKPNTFTTGSRNARPNGIAARGSQLEAWAMGKQAEVRKQRGSNNTQLRLGD